MEESAEEKKERRRLKAIENQRLRDLKAARKERKEAEAAAKAAEAEAKAQKKERVSMGAEDKPKRITFLQTKFEDNNDLVKYVIKKFKAETTFNYIKNIPILVQFLLDYPIQDQMNIYNLIYEGLSPNIRLKLDSIIKDTFETWKAVLIDAVIADKVDDGYDEKEYRKDLLDKVEGQTFKWGKLQEDFIQNKLRFAVRKKELEDIEQIPDELEDIQNAQNVEFWLENASMCRAMVDKGGLGADDSDKLIYARFEKYKNVCAGKLWVNETTIDFTFKKTVYKNITPTKFVELIKDCEDFMIYLSLRKEQKGHANLILIRDKIYRFEPHGAISPYIAQSETVDNYFKEVAKLLNTTYVPTEESCPTGKAIQLIAKKISKRGLCNYWSMLVIEILLINKKMTVPEVYELFNGMSPTQLSNIIYNYWWKIKQEMETETEEKIEQEQEGGCSCEGGGLNAKKIQHMSAASYKPNKEVKNIGRYRFDKSLSTSEAKVFVNTDTGKVVVANRGTKHTLKDWTNNLSLLLGQYKNTARYKNARDIQMKVVEKYPNFKVLNIGHSQGAAITKRLNEEGLTSEIININPAALPTDKKKDNETTIRSSADIVSMYDKPKKGDIMIKADSINPFKEHRTTIVNDIPPKTYIGLGHRSKFDWFK